MKSGFLGSPSRRILLGVGERDAATTRALSQTYSAAMGGGAIITPTLGTPTLRSLTPNKGPAAGSTSVTILGQNFLGTGIQVFFGGVACPTVTVTSPNQLDVLTPPHAAGLVSVVVATPFGVGLLINAYTYQPPGPVVFAVGDNNAAMASVDGINWTNLTVAGTGVNWTGLVWNGAKFAAISDDGAHSMTSPTGISWALGPSGPGVSWASNSGNFIWDGSQFVAVGLSNGTSNASTSPDALTWTFRPIGGSSDNTSALAFNGTRYVAFGETAGSTQLYKSTNAINWTGTAFPRSKTPYSCHWNGSLFVTYFPTLGADYSSDGISWTAASMPTLQNYAAFAWNGSIWVAVGQQMASSPDGINWSAQALPPGGYYLWVTYSAGLGLFIAVGNNCAAYSSDGMTWTASPSVPAGYYRAVASMV